MPPGAPRTLTVRASTAIRLLPPTAAEPVAEARRWLDALRHIGSSARLAPRREIDCVSHALRLRQETETETETETLALAFLGAVAEGLGKTLKLHRPGAESINFDEAWILRLLTSIRGDDLDSASFLIASRLRDDMRCSVRMLAGPLAECLEGVSKDPQLRRPAAQSG